jgi:hypothetical protein
MKETEVLSESKRRRSFKELVITIRRSSRHGIPAVYWQSKLAFVTYIYSYDGDRWKRGSNISDTRFANSLAIVVFSAGAFGAGIGQCFTKIIGG